MITLNTQLQKVMASQNLAGLRPFAYLYRNKWDSVNNKYTLENTAIDISSMIVKPNTLSMTLDVNEIAQFNANNITLTLTDYENKFIEGTPNSFFPSGYQLYGSRVVLYYGTNISDMVSLFVGVIKDLPTHKPEQYQVDLKLISPLQLLDDIEAKEFSDKYTGETLTLDHTDGQGIEFYKTANTGVGGIDTVYANGTKIYEGIDYNVSQLNDLAIPALIEITNTNLSGQTFTADYYIWKRSLTVEDIVKGLLTLGGYTSAEENISSVIWNSQVRNPPVISPVFATLGYYESATNEYTFNWQNTYGGSWSNTQGTGSRLNMMSANFDFNFILYYDHASASAFSDQTQGFCIGDKFNTAGENGVLNGLSFAAEYLGPHNRGTIEIRLSQLSNGTRTLLFSEQRTGTKSQPLTEISLPFKIEKRGSAISIYFEGALISTITDSSDYNFNYQYQVGNGKLRVLNQIWNIYDNNLTLIGANLQKPCIITQTLDKTVLGTTWGEIDATLQNADQAIYFLNVFFSNDGQNWDYSFSTNLGSPLSRSERYMYYILGINNVPSESFDIKDPSSFFYANNLTLNMVNLGNNSVLEAIQDLALISGYEFGVDRNGIFFFRPRLQSTTPIFELDETQIVKIENIKQNFNDFFTKLTLTFAEIPLEFYANTGTRPTLVDKYGIINKEINKPDIVNYDNPELAQAIGPQLLDIYSNLSNLIQCTAKLNLSLELGDIVNVKRNYNLNTPDAASDYEKFINQNTYYRACKITGINYNLAKKQMTYTLRDVSNSNTEPQQEIPQFIYTLPIEL